MVSCTATRALNPDKPELTNNKHQLILKVGQINAKLKSPNLKYDKIVKSRFKDWIPAFAGMTAVISIRF